MSIRVGPGERPASIAPPPCSQPDPDRQVEGGRLQGVLVEGVPCHQNIARSYRNGCYQHLLFTGIAGFAICNHFDKEILLVDPWPSFASYWTRVTGALVFRDIVGLPSRRPLTDQDSDAKSRIAELASFLRRAVEMEYTLTGILVSHMHFDHADDIVLLLELLAADNPGGTYTDHIGRIMNLSGNRMEPNLLPKIYCDYDTLIYLLTYGFYLDYRTIHIDGNDDFVPPRRVRHRQRYWYGNEHLRDILDERINDSADDANHFVNRNTAAWKKVKDRYLCKPAPGEFELVNNESWFEISAEGRRLHYDDSYNAYLHNPGWRCRAGQACAAFEVGHFNVQPYVWDHMKTGLGRRRHEAQDDQSAGKLQRLSSFLVKHRTAAGAKRTFIVGSAGEMSFPWTEAIADIDRPIETDLLIYAITRPRPSVFLNLSDQIDAYMESLVRNITVHEAILFCHFEEFVREVATTEQYVECFGEALTYNLDKLREISDHLDRPEFNRLIRENRIYALARHGTGFEVDMPEDPVGFWRNADQDRFPLRGS